MGILKDKYDHYNRMFEMQSEIVLLNLSEVDRIEERENVFKKIGLTYAAGILDKITFLYRKSLTYLFVGLLIGNFGPIISLFSQNTIGSPLYFVFAPIGIFIMFLPYILIFFNLRRLDNSMFGENSRLACKPSPDKNIL